MQSSQDSADSNLSKPLSSGLVWANIGGLNNIRISMVFFQNSYNVLHGKIQI